MNHRDAEMSSVTIIVHRNHGENVDQVVQKLTSMGVEVFEINRDVGVIEGSVEASQVPVIQKLDSIEAVRKVFSWVADYPVGDPRDQDGPETDDDAEER